MAETNENNERPGLRKDIVATTVSLPSWFRLLPIRLASRRSRIFGWSWDDVDVSADRGIRDFAASRGTYMKLLHMLLIPLSVTLLAASSVDADDIEAREAALFDHPARVRLVPPRSASDPGGELRCTYYSDLMIRETDVDQAGPGPASIIPTGIQQPVCSAAQAANEVVLKTNDYSYVGRKGRYLFFSATDPNGAVPFMIVDATSGRLIYTDARGGQGWKYVGLESGGLRLKFTRGVNGSCSLVKDGAACWAKIVRDSSFPRVISQAPAPLEACAEDYQKGKIPIESYSMVIYDVDMTVSDAGRPQVNSRGQVGCSFVP